MVIMILDFVAKFSGVSEFEEESSNSPIDMLGRYVENRDEGSESTGLMFMSMLASLLFLFSNLYFIWITHHGNKTLGQRHAFFTFYHMRENETLLNSFIANTMFKSLVSIGALQWTVLLYAEWTKGSFVTTIAVFNESNSMNVRLFNTSIFDYLLLIFVLIALISIGIRGSGRIRYNDVIMDKE